VMIEIREAAKLKTIAISSTRSISLVTLVTEATGDADLYEY
jgi:hypothetical protein